MVRIRMTRLGRTHRPFYRINAVDVRARRDGKVIEQLGWYNPVASKAKGEPELSLEAERIRYWLEKGAQPSETVMDILGRNDLLTPKLKAQWEADREASRNRVGIRNALKKAEEAVAALDELAGSTDADIAAFQKTAKGAVAPIKGAMSRGDLAKAESAAGEAEGALNSARQADEQAKAKAAAEQPAEEQPAEAQG